VLLRFIAQFFQRTRTAMTEQQRARDRIRVGQSPQYRERIRSDQVGIGDDEPGGRRVFGQDALGVLNVGRFGDLMAPAARISRHSERR